MSTLLGTSLDFAHLELLNVRIQQLAADPSSPAEGWVYWNTVTHAYKVYNGTAWIALGSGNGTVTTVSVATANGFAGSVANATTTPAITITTTITGVLKGNGTAVSAAVAADIPIPLTTKGDIFTFAAAGARLAVGTNKQVLEANSVATNGIDWVSMDHTFISDFDTQVRTSTLNQMSAPTADLSINSHKLTNVVDPTNPQDAATKNYVDITAQGLSYKAEARAATTANGTLASAFVNGSVIDGITLATGDRILIKNQTTGSENGIYTVNASGAPTRAIDADASGEIANGDLIYIQSGTVQAGQLWVCNGTGTTPWIPGSSSSGWAQFAGAADITASLPLLKTGNNLTLNQGNGITSSGGNLIVDTTVVVRKFAGLIGDGVATAIAVTHSLGSKDITASVRDAATDAFIICDITATSTTVATFTFAVAPAINAYRVVIHC